MKIRRLFVIGMIFALAIGFESKAAPVFNAPAVRVQPNGDTLRCLLTGDEYYHRLHDEAGYTIVQNPRTGWWVYATKSEVRRTENGERWDVVATDYVAGRVDPASVGLTPNVGVDRTTWLERQKRFDVPQQYQPKGAAKTSGRNHGVMNNVVIFVRFSDDTEISTPLSTINAMFNDSTAGATSMYNYFKTVSYGKLRIPTHYYPTPNGNNVVSYQDSLPRNYYMPYDATTNPNGYQNDSERSSREFGLLERAVNYVNVNSPISTTLNLDMDNDGKVDNICFVVKGTYTGWSDLLWPHKWSIYDRYVYINGKRVYTFNLQLEGSGEHYFSSSTFCHEMFHTLGAPDLYRYDNNTDVTGVGSWDLMCSNTTPPQNMGAYMKWKYGNWLDSIPEIRVPGTYTLHSLGDATYDNCVYKIAAQEPYQWYVLEYRDNTEQFETTLPGRGLVIYRIDERFNGNANFNGTDIFDEVYLFRPNAHDHFTNGTPAQGYFSGNTTRTQFTPTTNPHPWLSGNIIDSTFAITNIGVPGTTITFTYNDLRGCLIPGNFNVTGVTGHSAHLSWQGNSQNYKLQWYTGSSQNTTTVNVSGSSYDLTGLGLDSECHWRVKGMCTDGDSSGWSGWQTFHTASCEMPSDNIIAASDTTRYQIPVNAYYNYTYTQMIYTADQIGQPVQVTKIAFNYSSTNDLDSKDNVTIYMGHTSTRSFTSSNWSSLIPPSNLAPVYYGPLYCTTGWNEIVLDMPFDYNGTDNLVVAIDDNSGNYNGNSYRFYCTKTPDRFSSLSFYSDNVDPTPTESSFSGAKTRIQAVADLRLTGCVPQQTYEITVQVAEGGSAIGGGTYAEGEECQLTATADEHWHFSHWYDANGCNTITDNPYIFTVTGDNTFTANFAKDQYQISVTVDPASAQYGNAWFTTDEIDGHANDEVLEYGTVVTLYAEPRDNIANTVCTFDRWSDGSQENPRTLTLSQDTTIIASFNAEHVGIETADGSSVAIGVQDRNVTISGAEGRSIEVFDITGRTLYSTTGTDSDRFALPAAGVYIVRIENLPAKKIVIK